MRFWRRFILAWKTAATPDYVLDADLPGFWTDADARTLAGYFSTDSGRKLKVILRNYQVHAAQEAIMLRMTRGHARGIKDTVELLDRHFPRYETAEQPAPEPGQEMSKGEAAFYEQIGAT